MPKIVDHVARREQIAEAVWRVVAQHGVEALTVRAVAVELGATTGVVTHYFSNREALLLHAFDLVGQRAERRMRSHLELDDELLALTRVLREALPLDDRRRTEAAIWFAFIGLATGNEQLQQVARARYRDWQRLVTRLLDAALRRGRMAAGDPSELAMQAIAVTDGIALRAHLDGLSPFEQQRQLDAWLGGFAGSAETQRPAIQW